MEAFKTFVMSRKRLIFELKLTLLSLFTIGVVFFTVSFLIQFPVLFLFIALISIIVITILVLNRTFEYLFFLTSKTNDSSTPRPRRFKGYQPHYKERGDCYPPPKNP